MRIAKFAGTLVLASACRGTVECPGDAAASLDLLPPNSMVLLGDLHGTREIPRFVGSLACLASKRGPVVLALEIPRGHADAFDAFLDGAGAADERAQLLAHPWWQDPYQDGRRSNAMLELVDSARRLRRTGAPLEVVRFDVSERTASPEARDEAMAAAIVAARRERPDAFFIVYAGNLHTMKRGASWQPGYRWMAMRLAEAGVTFRSLNVRYTDGSAWTCRDGDPEHCGPAFVGSRYAEASGVHLEPSTDGNYDGWFGVGKITAAPPAAFPERAADLEQRLAALESSPGAWRARARRAYAAGDYRGCAEQLAQIGSPEADVAYDHACCLARAGERDAALERLRFALDHGLEQPERARDDADLAALRDDPRWPL
ncbi:MAG TPA: hypothetical protein VJS92_11700 [Candidatus Polarisedimenticolaceae bacterium]|nr:hypothetical protein [Candidatus Polarisedimenticolaceae bacterium]